MNEDLLELLGVVGRGEDALQRVAADAGAHDAFNHLFEHQRSMKIDWHFLNCVRKAGLPIKPQALTAYAIPREDRAATPRR